MFGLGSIGGQELLVLVLLALLLFGPRKIPEIGRTVGKALRQFRRASHEFRTGIEREVEAERLKDAGEAMRSIREEVGAVAREATRPDPEPTERDTPSAGEAADDSSKAATADRPDPNRGESPPERNDEPGRPEPR